MKKVLKNKDIYFTRTLGKTNLFSHSALLISQRTQSRNKTAHQINPLNRCLTSLFEAPHCLRFIYGSHGRHLTTINESKGCSQVTQGTSVGSC